MTLWARKLRPRTLADIPDDYPRDETGAPLQSGCIWPACKSEWACSTPHCPWALWHDREPQLAL